MTKAQKQERRRSWRVKSHYTERFPGEYSEDQMSMLAEEAAKRNCSIIEVIRDAIDARYEMQNGRRQDGQSNQ